MAELKRSQGYMMIIAITVTTVIGTGLFMGSSLGAAVAGNLSLVAWIILSVMAIYTALIFGELVSMFPNTGGVYEFAKRTYGRFISFMVGWVAWLVANITTCVLIVTAIEYIVPSGYVISFLPHVSTEVLKILFAIIIILAMNYITYRGVDASAKVLVFFAVMTIGILLAVIIPGLFSLDYSYFYPFAYDNPGVSFDSYMIEYAVLIFVCLFFISESFFGWESATFLAEETRNAEKIIPRSLFVTCVVIGILGILLAVVMLGNIHHTELAETVTPFEDIAHRLYPPEAWTAIKLGVFLTMIGSAAGGAVGSPRLLLALARDKLFINRMADIHETYRTPHKAILFQTIVAIIITIIGFAEYRTLLSMLVPLAVIMYLSVIIAVPVLRYKMPHVKRHWRVPFGRIGPLIVTAFYCAVIASWLLYEADAWGLFKLLVSFVFFGVPIYLLLMFYYDPDVIVKLNDFFAYFTLAFERILIPKRIDRAIFEHIGPLEGKQVLEFGCGVGTFTKELARAVGEQGIVYATDVSYTSVRIANRRIAKRGHINVRFIHDIHQVNRVHHSVPQVDCIVSIGMLGYLQDIGKVLKEMNRILPESGRIFFMDYVDLFKVIPNVSWISHKDELIRVFREAGFSVKIEKLKGTFWNYLFIYGIKTEHDVPFI